MRVCAADAVDLGTLTGAERFMRIQTSRACQQPLPPQDFVDTRDVPCKTVSRFEECTVGVGNRDVMRAQCRGNLLATVRGVTLVEERDRTLRPHRPMAELASHHPAPDWHS